jgi:hypothetical protein
VIQVRSAAPEDKAYELGRGSYVLEVTPNDAGIACKMFCWGCKLGVTQQG